MFEWKKMCADTASYPGLLQELRNCSGRYILDNVKMPESCGGRVCTIEFIYYGDDYIKLICANSPVEYSGQDAGIARWLENGTVEFGSFEQLTNFLALFGESSADNREDMNRPEERISQNNVPEQRSAQPARPVTEFDRDGITVPNSKSQYILVDKDKLFLDLSSEIFGQDENIRKIVHLICNHLGTKNRKRPISVFLYGSPGTGKSKIAELLTEKINEQLSGRDKLFYRPFDCTQLQHPEDISRLTGAAPGYVGYDQPGVFSVLEDHPNTVFVFDEIEKAADNVTEVLMQAMETGRQETNGKTLSNGASYYDLSRSVIFFTSNIELEERKMLGFGTADREQIRTEKTSDETNIARKISKETKEAKAKLLESGKFRREVISRMTAVIRFNDLSGDSLKDIAVKCIRDIADDHRLYITKIETPVLQEFINETAGMSEDFGAREFREEAANFFGDAFLEYSHSHTDYAEVIISGTIDNVMLIPACSR